MIKNLIGAALGSKLAKSSPVQGGAAGAAIATAVPFVLSRLSIPAMIALGVGGYYLKRRNDKKNEQDEATTTAPAKPVDRISDAAKSKTKSAETVPAAVMSNGTGKSVQTASAATS